MILSSEDLERLDGALRLAFKPNELKRVLKYRLRRNLEDVTLATNWFTPPAQRLRKGGTRISAIASDVAAQGVSFSSPKR
ncbi:MAG: hypothetical protein EOM91_11270 [Sphingobacteriia bacterium]|nr:hypothetical protein [Sphingobacteriia bacterium]NCC40653.1 hypothetical protein [Gammaproteobacteria bacterium]